MKVFVVEHPTYELWVGSHQPGKLVPMTVDGSALFVQLPTKAEMPT
jgi:hypothetical protein